MLFFSIMRNAHVELICTKKHAASKTCYYNFKVDGEKFSYADRGCKFKKTEEVLDMAKAGELALVRDWKIPCAEK